MKIDKQCPHCKCYFSVNIEEGEDLAKTVEMAKCGKCGTVKDDESTEIA